MCGGPSRDSAGKTGEKVALCYDRSFINQKKKSEPLKWGIDLLHSGNADEREKNLTKHLQESERN